MQQPFCQSALKLVLSAAVLVWGTVPPPVRHGHEGGSDRNHSHTVVAENGKHGHHEHGHHEHGHRHHDVDSVPLPLSNFATHLHWHVFGIDFSLPEPNGEQDESPQAPWAILDRLAGDAPVYFSPSDHWIFNSLIAAPPPNPLEVLTDTLPARHANLSASILLCDSARAARSDVLLA